ncbi:hypothetical protein PG997_005412 [Apiospora hydei]|uniref:Cyclochlorotine biosynthesis protein O n=1 Tax=Apiospora hydei TaxID=1337664 RepID=A0ABR1X4W1_9PEZI
MWFNIGKNKSHAGYGRVPGNPKERGIGANPSLEPYLPEYAQRKSVLESRPIVLAVFLIQCILIVALSIHAVLGARPSDGRCAVQLSPYSPYLESGDLGFEDYTEQNHLMQPSPYRGHPTPAVEDAWLRLWRLPYIQFPEDKLQALNKTPAERYAHTKDGGVQGFLNVFHQLHCLNFVRQYTYRDQYDYSNVTTFRAPDALVRGHVDHCVETIRKYLMCNADVTPVVFERDESNGVGFKSDFNMRRKCRDFGKIQRWTMENAASAVLE